MGIWTRRIVRLALVLAIIGAIVVPLAAVGTRFELWPVTLGLGMLAGGAIVAALGLAVGTISCLWSMAARSGQGLRTGMIAVIIGAVVAFVPLRMMMEVRSNNYPPIHDITTDTEHAPEFVAIVPLRGKDANSIVYDDKFLPKNGLAGEDGGKHFAEVQTEFYPDIQPVMVQNPLSQTFDKALSAAKAQGWEIVAALPEDGRIEATDTTFWFGFKDDVVIRLEEQGRLTKLDIRSSSRVGMSDVGKNAKRIRSFLSAFSAQ